MTKKPINVLNANLNTTYQKLKINALLCLLESLTAKSIWVKLFVDPVKLITIFTTINVFWLRFLFKTVSIIEIVLPVWDVCQDIFWFKTNVFQLK